MSRAYQGGDEAAQERYKQRFNAREFGPHDFEYNRHCPECHRTDSRRYSRERKQTLKRLGMYTKRKDLKVSAFGLFLLLCFVQIAWSNVVAFAQVGPAVLTWQDTSGGLVKCPQQFVPGCDQEDRFNIERSINGGTFFLLSTAVADATGYSDSSVYRTVGVANTFCYRVSATNGTGTSDYTNTACKSYPALPFSPTVNIGETVIGTLADSGNSNLLLAQYASLSQTATIQSLAFYVTTASGSLRLGIYDSSGPNGGPGVKIAETNTFATTTGWNTANVIKPVLLTAGTYWLAYLPQNNALAFVKNDSSVQPSRYYAFNFNVMPGIFSVTPSQTPSHWSLYATLSTQQFAPANAPGNLTIGTQ